MKQGKTATAVEDYTMVPTYKKGDKNDHTNYTGISMLSTTYKIVSNILSQG
jgi:hypothetical protein